VASIGGRERPFPAASAATPISRTSGAYGRTVPRRRSRVYALLTTCSLRGPSKLAAPLMRLSPYRTKSLEQAPPSRAFRGADRAVRRSDQPGPLTFPCATVELATRLRRPSVGSSAPLEEVRAAVSRLAVPRAMCGRETYPAPHPAGSVFTNPILAIDITGARQHRPIEPLDRAPAATLFPPSRTAIVKTSRLGPQREPQLHKGFTGRPADHRESPPNQQPRAHQPAARVTTAAAHRASRNRDHRRPFASKFADKTGAPSQLFVGHHARALI